MSAPTVSKVARARASIAGRTLRTDNWRLQPILTAMGLGAFVVYGLIRAVFINKWYYDPVSHLQAPFYSPCLTESCVEGSADFGRWLPDLGIISPAMLILILPGGFRLTCYYYRKSYYRSFWASPPACAVAEPHKKYTGETRFPLIFQNIHRYFWYAAILVVLILTFDLVKSFGVLDGEFGFGLGTLILVVNAVLLWAYTLSCHSCRHIVGGRIKHFSKHPVRFWMWGKVSALNAKHMQLAWASLVSVLVADIYIMLVSAGVFSDLRFLN